MRLFILFLCAGLWLWRLSKSSQVHERKPHRTTWSGQFSGTLAGGRWAHPRMLWPLPPVVCGPFECRVTSMLHIY